jgi:hypothetical protein
MLLPQCVLLPSHSNKGGRDQFPFYIFRLRISQVPFSPSSSFVRPSRASAGQRPEEPCSASVSAAPPLARDEKRFSKPLGSSSRRTHSHNYLVFRERASCPHSGLPDENHDYNYFVADFLMMHMGLDAYFVFNNTVQLDWVYKGKQA